MLRNRKHQEATIKGVDLVDEETDLDLGQFTSLQNWIPSEVYSIKKKRGISPLNPNALLSITTEASDPITTEASNPLITEF